MNTNDDKRRRLISGLVASDADERPTLVPIRELGAAFRPQIKLHLLTLSERDRYLRFGHAAADGHIREYVDGLDFGRDHVYGIFNRKLNLIAMAHLAHFKGAEEGAAEFGVSVVSASRGRGYGTLLFERAAIHAVNSGVDRLYIYALSENAAMLHIATKVGGVIERYGSEAEACVQLPRATFESRVREFVIERVGQLDYWIKSENAALYREVVGDDAPAAPEDVEQAD